MAPVPVPGTATPTRVDLFLMDTPGASIFNMRDEGTKQWESANMVAVVFDVGSKESFASAAKWLRRYMDARAGTDGPGSRPLVGAYWLGEGGAPCVSEVAQHHTATHPPHTHGAGVLIGNKCDFRDIASERAEVTPEEALAFASSAGLTYFETSAVRAFWMLLP